MDALTRQKLNDFSDQLSFLEKHPLTKLPDGQYWTGNLKIKVEGAVWKHRYSCYLYTWEQAQQAVPPGFHLPSKKDYSKLCQLLEKNTPSPLPVPQQLQQSWGFETMGRYNQETHRLSGKQSLWWTGEKLAHLTRLGLAFALWRDEAYAMSLEFDDYCPVRLIKDN